MNGGILQASHKCSVPMMPDLQECWYSSKAVTNILLFHDVASKYHIKYDNKVSDEFIMQLSPVTLLQFTPLKVRLYIWKLTNAKI